MLQRKQLSKMDKTYIAGNVREKHFLLSELGKHQVFARNGDYVAILQDLINYMAKHKVSSPDGFDYVLGEYMEQVVEDDYQMYGDTVFHNEFSKYLESLEVIALWLYRCLDSIDALTCLDRITVSAPKGSGAIQFTIHDSEKK